MIVIRTLAITVILFLACFSNLPSPSAAHGDKHHNSKTLEMLLATGVVAKFLQKKKAAHYRASHPAPNPHPPHHHHPHRAPPPPPPPPPPPHPHGAPSIKIIVPQRPEVHYVHQPAPQHEPQVTYAEEAYPERTYAESARLVPRRTIVPYPEPARLVPHRTVYPRLPPHLIPEPSVSRHLVARRRRPQYDPRDKIEVIRI